ncbi:MAG TPA: acetate uptake transporter [Methanomassiliicoccales archaeon]|nr:acetate uptake transporter [Methanomassiliicoccales archaeon]
MVSEVETVQKDRTANPAPLGLCAFGITTILLNLHNVGLFALGSVVLAMGIFYGGLAQVVVGVMEWKKGNGFGALAFMSYGLFWLSLVGIVLLPSLGLASATQPAAMASYLGLWGFLTLFLFPIALRSSGALGFVFGSLAILFFALCVGEATGDGGIVTAAGIWGLIVGSSAVYTGLAELYNSTFGRPILPLWEPKQKTRAEPSEKALTK